MGPHWTVIQLDINLSWYRKLHLMTRDVQFQSSASSSILAFYINFFDDTSISQNFYYIGFSYYPSKALILEVSFCIPFLSSPSSLSILDTPNQVLLTNP